MEKDQIYLFGDIYTNVKIITNVFILLNRFQTSDESTNASSEKDSFAETSNSNQRENVRGKPSSFIGHPINDVTSVYDYLFQGVKS